MDNDYQLHRGPCIPDRGVAAWYTFTQTLLTSSDGMTFPPGHTQMQHQQRNSGGAFRLEVLPLQSQASLLLCPHPMLSWPPKAPQQSCQHPFVSQKPECGQYPQQAARAARRHACADNAYLAPDQHGTEYDLQPVKEIVPYDDHRGASRRPSFTRADGFDTGSSCFSTHMKKKRSPSLEPNFNDGRLEKKKGGRKSFIF